jgi:nicotinate-nucleotide adenylyltransferase
MGAAIDPMEFLQRAAGQPERLGILPGAFNPITVAHLALARAALRHVNEVVFVVPRVFPHKNYSGASFSERLSMLREAASGESAFSIATTDGGLFLEIARECHAAYGDHVRLSFLCGRDAAERIVGWDYGRPEAVVDMLRQFELLVADREGAYEPAGETGASVRRLETGCLDGVSATEVRERIARGDAWEHLVPEAIIEHARRIYSR